MDSIKISLDSVPYASKAECEANVGSISNRIGRQIKNLSRKDVLHHLVRIGAGGHSFCPATFKDGKRRTENFEQMQVFVLDFDETLGMSAIYDRTEKYNLPMLFAYETLSSVDCNRFRVAFMNDVPVTDIRAAQIIQNKLMTIFPEADPKCKSISQMYFGGKKLLYTNEFFPLKDEPILKMNIESLARNMALYLKDKHGPTHYKRKVSDFAKSNGIRLNEKGLLDILVRYYSAEIHGSNHDGNNLPNSSIILSADGRNLPCKSYQINLSDNPTISSATNKGTSNYHLPFRSYDLKRIAPKCQLFQEFESGSRLLHHDELFGIATNIIQVEGGVSYFKQLLRSHSYFDDRTHKYKDWDYYLQYIKPVRNQQDKSKTYSPYSCDGFCPYKDKCPHGVNIVSTCLLHQMERLANYEEIYVTIEEAEQDFKKKLTRAFYSSSKLVHVIKAGCALGKTQAILELLRETPYRVLIAVPTLALKSELCKRALAMGFHMTESPSLRELKDELPDEILDHIERLYSSGKSPIPYIKKVITKAKDNPCCVATFMQYLEDLETFYNADSHAITTHKRLETMDVSKYDFIIIDEDIIFNSIFRSKVTIKIPTLKKLAKKIAPASAISQKIKKVLKCTKDEELFALPKVEWDGEDDGIPLGFDMPSFAAATHFISRNTSDREDEDDPQGECVTYMKPVDFKKNTMNIKVIMLSATADEKICRYYFGDDRVIFHECKTARYLGTLNQYPDRSYSRSNIVKDPSVISKIKKATGFLHTITFKKFKHLLPNKDELHIGNTEGRDHLKGENIDVIATPHQPEWIYKLCAYSLGLDFDETAILRPDTTVDHNGYRFRLMTYKDEVLRAIQFYFLESELEQCVGRARLLRCNCTVNLFSNFPLRQARMMMFEYDKKPAAA